MAGNISALDTPWKQWTLGIVAFLATLTSSGIIYLAQSSRALLNTHGDPVPPFTLTREYTYRNSDYPDEWPIGPLDTVHLSLENTVHYAFNTPAGRAEWNTTLPSGGALVYLGPKRRPFTLGMLHQIRCLGILREILDDFYMDQSPDAKIQRPQLATHCMNYLRQMVLCNADMRLESVRASSGQGITVNEATHTCRDWTAVYKAGEDNYLDFTQTSIL